MNVIDPAKIKAAVDSILSDPVKKAEFLSSVKRLSGAINDLGVSLKQANFSFEDARRVFKNVENGYKTGEKALLAAGGQVGRSRWPGAAPGCHEADPAGAAEGVPMGQATGSQVGQPPGDAKAERPSR